MESTAPAHDTELGTKTAEVDTSEAQHTAEPAEETTAAPAAEPARVEPLEVFVPPHLAEQILQAHAQIPLADAQLQAAQASLVAAQGQRANLNLTIENLLLGAAAEVGLKPSELARWEQRGAGVALLKKSVTSIVPFPGRE